MALTPDPRIPALLAQLQELLVAVPPPAPPAPPAAAEKRWCSVEHFARTRGKGFV